MRKDEALAQATEIEQMRPDVTVMMIVNGVGMLREAKIAPPAWVVPSQMWMVMCHHAPSNDVGLVYGDSPMEEQVCNLVNAHVFLLNRAAGRAEYVDEWLHELDGKVA